MARYLFLILALTVNIFPKVYEELDKTTLLNTTALELRVNGAKGRGKVYYSKFNLPAAKSAFNNYMQSKGYSESGNSGNIVSYKKGDLNTKALFASNTKGTAIISVESEGEGKKSANGDVPGTDLLDIPRPKNSRRELCLERLSGNECSTTLVYKIKESTSSCNNYYKDIMEKQGWNPLTFEKTGEGVLLVFEAEKKWCNIFICDDKVIISRYLR
jgi:hypothetical protein